MNCKRCDKEIDQGRIEWATERGYQVKYCKECSDKYKQEKAEENRSQYHGSTEVAATTVINNSNEDQKWHEIGVSKIVHNFMRDAYNQGKNPKQCATEAKELYLHQSETVKSIIESEKDL